MLGLILFTLTVALAGYLLKTIFDKSKVWEKRGVKHLKMSETFTLIPKKNFFEVAEELCSKYPNEPIVGMYLFCRPILIVQDLDYIDRILTKDFNHFTERGLEINEEKNPLDAQLFFMPGTNRWRAVRHKMTPLFTSGKMRSMFKSMEECGKNLSRYLEKISLTEVDLKEVTNLMFIDIAGSAIFGIEANVLENPDSEFRKMSKKVFDFGPRDRLVGFVMTCMPWLGRNLGLSFNKPEAVRYFVGVLKKAFDERASGGQERDDFVKLLMQLKEKGSVEVQQWDSKDDYLLHDDGGPKDTETVELTDSILMSQAYSFLIAGVDMLAIVTMYAAFDLSQNLEIQEKLRSDITKKVDKHQGLTYDALKEMVYLENVIKESQRLHPSALQLMRKCTKDYTFPNGLTVYSGENLFIPLMAVHYNPNYFPEPEAFKPDRFESLGKVPAFLSFGDGPRMCIAMRFALLQAKFCMATILMKYRIRLNPATVLPLGLQKNAGFLIPKNDVLFDLEDCTKVD